jgi:hypothetical protein
MKTLIYAETRQLWVRERDSFHLLKPAMLLRRFRRYIETSDREEQLLRRERFLDTICKLTVLLSVLAISPFLIAILGK